MFKTLSQLKQKADRAAWNFIQGADRGQALSEYGVIIGVVVGLIVVAVVIVFRDEIVAAFKSATAALRAAR